MSQEHDDRRRPHDGDANVGSPSPNLRRLLERMWKLGFGIIRGLHVRNGDPVFDPPFSIVCSIRLADDGMDRPRTISGEFVMNRAQRALQRQLALIGTGVIDVIKVHDGLPVNLEFRESA